jgi:streptomycin 6-kinase
MVHDGRRCPKLAQRTSWPLARTALAENGDVTEWVLPENLVHGVAVDPAPERHRWLDTLAGTVAALAREWDLQLGDPYQPGGQCSWVAPARGPGGEPFVLKVGWLHPEARREADALRFWDGNGSVMVHADRVADDTIALLLERCEPGLPLTTLAEPDQDPVVCGLLRALWREVPTGHTFPSLEAMCQMWADEYADAAEREPPELDQGIARDGLELFRSLAASADRHVLLATDLHAENVLSAEREPWLVIDPKPHVGDPAYDALQHMLNCDRLLTDPAGLARRVASLLDIDAQRLLLWLFARCVVESPGNPDAARVATLLAP